MKKFALPFVIKCAALVLLCGHGALAQAGSDSNTVSSVSRMTPPVLVRSVFVDDPRVGKDPFFPNSARRQAAVVEVASVNRVAPPSSELFNKLTLKGISGVRGQRLALINSSTLAVGERADVRAGSQFIKIRCREIRDSSVLIELDGGSEVRELKLRQGI